MKRLKELQELMKKNLNEQEKVNAVALQAKTENDEKAISGAKSQLETLETEFKSMESELESIQAFNERRSKLEKLEGKSDNNVIDDLESKGGAGSVSATASKGWQAKDSEHTGLFLDFACGKAMSDNALGAIEGKSKSKDDDGMGNYRAVIPKSMLIACLYGMQSKAYDKYQEMLAKGPMLSTGGNGLGGNFLFPTEDFFPSVVRFPVIAPDFINEVNVVPVSTGKAVFPKLDQSGGAAGNFGGVQFNWIAEGAAKIETDAKFQQLEIQTKEVAGWTQVSNTMLRRNQIGLENFLNALFSNAMRYEWANKIINGNGTTEPSGIITDLTGGGQVVPRDTNGEINWEDYVNLEFQVRKGLRQGAKYVIADTVEKATKLKKDSEGNPLFTNNTGGPIRTTLAGYDYDSTDLGIQPVLNSEGDAIFGNFAAYTWAVDQEMTMARSTEVGFLNNLTTFKIESNVGGKINYDEAFSILAAGA